MDRKKYSKRKVIIPAALCAAVIVTVAAVLFGADSYRNHIRKKVLSYDQETNEQGIAQYMDDNPYFATKQPGFAYREPDVIKYYSGVTDSYRHAAVILPDDYDEDKKYPVLYLLHGLGGSHKTWINKDADVIIHNLNYFNNVPDMIVVLPNSEVNKEEDADNLPIEERIAIYDKTEEDLINYLMPYIEEKYPVKTGRDNTAIAGNSMGGRNTIYIAFKHQDIFGYAGAFSTAGVVKGESKKTVMYPLLDDLVIDPEYGGFKLLMLEVGNEDNVCGWVTYNLDRMMTEKGIEHIFYDTNGGHQTKVWQNALYNFCLRLFTNDNK